MREDVHPSVASQYYWHKEQLAIVMLRDLRAKRRHISTGTNLKNMGKVNVTTIFPFASAGTT